ncbi:MULTISPECIES: hypothetical protein [Pseudomonas]|uniref:hypothetical protein n=1 Tax=Pseudomonas TaxID=286 RepID=UPI00300298E4
MTKLDLYQPDFEKRSYWLAFLIAIDQLFNTLFAGWPDETISSRAHREQIEWAESLINALFFFDRQGDIRHCELAYYGELAGEQFPIN